MPKKRFLTIAITSFLCSVAPPALSAQLVVRVQSGGLPVANAEVAVWDTAGRVGYGRTDGIGRLQVQLERTTAASSFLMVRRIGFVAARVPLERKDSVTVDLEPAVVRLPVLAVRTKELRCPNKDEAEADSVWRDSMARYLPRGTQFQIDWTGYTTVETVTAEQRGYGDPYELRPPSNQIFGSVRGEAGLENPPPYAFYERHIGMGGEYWQWRYAALASFSSDHFLSERFRATHTLSVLGRTDQSTLIGFCPRDRSQADLQGELLIGTNAMLLSARWFFHVPHDDEDAGGEATFAPTPYEGRDYLVAIRGSSWRRAGKEIYNQRRFERRSWSLRPRGSGR